MTLTVATWNVNSVRARRGHVGHFVRRHRPDVLCLQETRVSDPEFPAEPFARLGYHHRALSGARGSPGVAIFSRLPIAASRAETWCGKPDHRHVAVKLENGLEIHNFYVPAGGDVPDPAVNAKFAHKLAFLAEMAKRLPGLVRAQAPVMLVGDLNVAPLESDVWSHRQLRRTITHTEAEIKALEKARRSVGWIDVMREFVPPEEKLFTWWSYRSPDYRAANRGRRLDHVWATPALAKHCAGMTVATEVRGWKRPSDHVPVIVRLKL